MPRAKDFNPIISSVEPLLDHTNLDHTNRSSDKSQEIDQALVAFAAALRVGGVNVDTSSVITFAQGLMQAGFANCYWVGRSTLINKHEDIDIYDQVFFEFWTDWLRVSQFSESDIAPAQIMEIVLGFDNHGVQFAATDKTESDHPLLSIRWSAVETLRDRDFSDLTSAEMQQVSQLIQDFGQHNARRQSRRLRVSARGQIDMRATVRKAWRTSGDVIKWCRQQRRFKPRRVIILCDISGSMSPYSEPLLRLLYAGVAGGGEVEAFSLGTRLTRITRELSGRDPSTALRRAVAQMHDFSGGTRLGECLQTFNKVWGLRGMARGAVVVILSDGWDRGDAEILTTALTNLRRVTHRIVWVNPLKATESYAPLAGGMAAALPYVDDFLAGNSLNALDEVVAAIGRS